MALPGSGWRARQERAANLPHGRARTHEFSCLRKWLRRAAQSGSPAQGKQLRPDTRRQEDRTWGKRKPGVGLKRAHREIVDTWAMPCLDGCSCKRGANTQWAAERGRGDTRSTRRDAPVLQSHRKMFLSMLAEIKCRPMERSERLA